MNQKQTLRLTVIITMLICIAIAMSLVLYALKQNINLFYTPTELKHSENSIKQIVRLGGYVLNHSVHYDDNGKGVTFTVTDQKNNIVVHYEGVLPSLFREGQGVVVTGKLLDQNSLLASQVLAKHDEKYMPWGLSSPSKKGGEDAT